MTENRPLPKGWQWVRFGDVVRQMKETTKDPESRGLTRIVGLEHLDPESLPLRRWQELDELPDGTSFTRVFRTGQVLFAKRRAYQRKVAVADFDGVCSSDILVFEASGDEMLVEFLPYIVQSDGFFDHALGTSAGSLSPRTKWQELAKYEFALPPSDLQRQISATMAGFENYISALTHATESVRALEKAIVGELSREGNPTTLGELASNGGIQIGPFGSQLHAHEYVDEGVPVVMPTDLTAEGLRYDTLRMISEGTAERLAKHRVRTWDILLPRRGDLNKRALINDHEAGWLCGTGSVRVRLDRPDDAPLVVRLLRSTDVVRWLEMNAVGTTMPNLNADIVSRIPVSMPDAENRDRYTSLVSSASALSSGLNTALTSVRRARMATLNELLETSSVV